MKKLQKIAITQIGGSTIKSMPYTNTDHVPEEPVKLTRQQRRKNERKKR